MSKVKDTYLIKVIEYEHEEPLVHIRNIGPTDHVTMCGLDGGLASDEQKTLPLNRGDKMNCPSCRTYYERRHGLNIDKRWLAD
ncbi:hypothetical protein [Photobacterium damselae]|uniref:hypothetical protein n=1 Tax=Photobacterium damselae TaxID=38293 RepID=UPI004068371B